ncbi:MAG: sigma-54-dependent Fis family transcriptional regulator, partial [Acidobacteriota bacterium]
MPRGRILVVDDEESIRTTLRQILEDEGYSVTVCEDGETALKLLDKGDFEIVLLDVWLPGMDGIQVMEEMNRQRRTEEVLMISGHGTIDTAVRATRVGAYDFIEKPLSLERVLVGVQNALQKHRL